MTYGTQCHVIGHFVSWYYHVTYSTLSRASGYLATTTAADSRGRFLFSDVPYYELLVAFFQDFPGAASLTSNSAGLHADLGNIVPAGLFG